MRCLDDYRRFSKDGGVTYPLVGYEFVIPAKGPLLDYCGREGRHRPGKQGVWDFRRFWKSSEILGNPGNRGVSEISEILEILEISEILEKLEIPGSGAREGARSAGQEWSARGSEERRAERSA